MEHNRENILRLKHVVSLSTTNSIRARRASSEIDVAGTSLFSIDSPIQLVGSVSISHQATFTREKCVYRGETAVVAVSSCQLGRLVAFPWTFSHFFKFLEIWKFEFLKIWKFENLKIWIFENLNFWIFENLKIQKFEFLKIWKFKYLNFLKFENLKI